MSNNYEVTNITDLKDVSEIPAPVFIPVENNDKQEAKAELTAKNVSFYDTIEDRTVGVPAGVPTVLTKEQYETLLSAGSIDLGDKGKFYRTYKNIYDDWGLFSDGEQYHYYWDIDLELTSYGELPEAFKNINTEAPYFSFDLNQPFWYGKGKYIIFENEVETVIEREFLLFIAKNSNWGDDVYRWFVAYKEDSNIYDWLGVDVATIPQYEDVYSDENYYEIYSMYGILKNSNSEVQTEIELLKSKIKVLENAVNKNPFDSGKVYNAIYSNVNGVPYYDVTIPELSSNADLSKVKNKLISLRMNHLSEKNTAHILRIAGITLEYPLAIGVDTGYTNVFENYVWDNNFIIQIMLTNINGNDVALIAGPDLTVQLPT